MSQKPFEVTSPDCAHSFGYPKRDHIFERIDHVALETPTARQKGSEAPDVQREAHEGQ